MIATVALLLAVSAWIVASYALLRSHHAAQAAGRELRDRRIAELERDLNMSREELPAPLYQVLAEQKGTVPTFLGVLVAMLITRRR